MKPIVFIPVLLLSLVANAQLKLDRQDFDHLVSIGNLYSKDPNAARARFTVSMDSLQTPQLRHIADVLIRVGKGDLSMLEHSVLGRPDDDELLMWYVIREIHYDRINKERTPRGADVVAKEVLERKIDSRILLDNYYYLIHGGLASLFNDADLSAMDIDIESLGFKNKTEKAIFYFNVVDALIGGRSKVLSSLKKYETIVSFSKKLPTVNGKPYYFYRDLDFDDFDWVGYAIVISVI
ncbi:MULTISPECIES: hypothetical protein [unclassified Flavobacterium]|uniref:hypothetical protein n=1 Tax=unclassified Flavobacterium TaxID=196869 RepID=UPI001F1385E8|nr:MULTISPECIES: hypothetical protein [unclassified Flavobacterium]UMY64852.1 hypothetical protein MKO97_10045 [Flavobacterium sp. HJ-32-4]